MAPRAGRTSAGRRCGTAREGRPGLRPIALAALLCAAGPAPAQDGPIRETQDVPTRETQDVPTRETQDVPTRETQDVPTRETQDVPTRETQDVPTRETPVATLAALYPRDGRRDLTGADIDRYPGAGVLFCHGPDGIPRKAAAAWLVGDPSVVVLNAHNFRNRRLETTREVGDCFFQIGGRNYDFVPGSMELGAEPATRALHITDDWAILRLVRPVEGVRPQPVPAAPELGEGPAAVPVVMVSPGGHENYRGPASLEACAIRQVDPPSEGGIRRLRHDCNDGFGGSGSGLFDGAGRLVAMQSASLSMNARKPFDIEFHYGSALAFEGALLAALRRAVAGPGP